MSSIPNDVPTKDIKKDVTIPITDRSEQSKAIEAIEEELPEVTKAVSKFFSYSRKIALSDDNANEHGTKSEEVD